MANPTNLVRSTATHDFANRTPPQSPNSPPTPDNDEITLQTALYFADQQQRSTVQRIQAIFACTIL